MNQSLIFLYFYFLLPSSSRQFIMYYITRLRYIPLFICNKPLIYKSIIINPWFGITFYCYCFFFFTIIANSWSKSYCDWSCCTTYYINRRQYMETRVKSQTSYIHIYKRTNLYCPMGLFHGDVSRASSSTSIINLRIPVRRIKKALGNNSNQNILRILLNFTGKKSSGNGT